MKPDDLAELGLAPEELAWLRARGIRCRSQFAMTFLLPEQHAVLAAAWNKPLGYVADLVQREAANLPADEVARLVREVRRVEQIRPGVLRPPADERTPP